MYFIKGTNTLVCSSGSEHFVEKHLRIRLCPKIVSKRDDSDKEGVFQNTFISERGQYKM